MGTMRRSRAALPLALSLAIALTAGLVTLSLAVVGVARGDDRVAALGMGLAIAFTWVGKPDEAMELLGTARAEFAQLQGEFPEKPQ